MEALGGRPRVRPIVVDFLATLFHTFCIGVTVAVTLAACVVLLAGEARGTEIATTKGAGARQGKPLPDAHVLELALAHHLATKHTGLVVFERAPAAARRDRQPDSSAHRRAGAPSRAGCSLSANRGAPASLVRAAGDGLRARWTGP